MASARFKSAIASQLAQLTGGDASHIARAIGRPKVKGHGTFALPLPRLFPPNNALKSKKSPAGVKEKTGGSSGEQRSTGGSGSGSSNDAVFDTSGLIRSVAPAGNFLNFSVDERRYTRETIDGVVKAEEAKRRVSSHPSSIGPLSSVSTTVTAPTTSTSTLSSIPGLKQSQIASLGYGLDPTVGLGQVIAIDYSSPNIAKPFHGGHLRGTILGNFATRLLRGFGYQVIGINYLGDWGKQYGLMAVGFERYGDRAKLHEDPIKHLYDVYVRINQDISEDPALEKLANHYFKKMEDRSDPHIISLWQEFRSLSIDFYTTIYKRLGIEFDVYSGESETTQHVPEVYDLLRRKHLLKEQEDGAWVVDLTDYGLGVCVLQRADGTTLYLTRDVAACLDRQERFGFSRHLYMIGDDQNLHMKRLFKIMELVFKDEADAASSSSSPHWSRSLQHISFGKVHGMSTRRGQAVFLEDILDTAQSTMLERMKENDYKFEAVKESFQDHQQVQDKSAPINKASYESGAALVADQLGISAVVIQDFQAKSSKGYEFSWKRMTESTGNTGVYLQYAHARLCGIESKAGTKLNPDADTDLLTEPEAFELANMISMYPDVTLQTLETLEPSTIVNYLFALSHAISSANQVLQVKSVADQGQPELAEARLLLLWAARVTLGNGMRILGLEPQERM
ncbi:Arginyl-tRNA synthetase [Dissophora globulifera]|uniref:arginine--tRNA ligase n=1 Tax=Dissophora globulifera TaxID=979702 RepID=A0A9P6R879_9FUNG|nr:Arginyl-tRNA synthetase [Dissophora globulifera]